MLVQQDFKNQDGLWVSRSRVGGKSVWTVSGVMWNNIKERCTEGGATQTREPTYKGCSNDFHDFQSFTEWHVKQVGYGEGYQLDADILRARDKRYSEDTCLLIPAALNKFLQSATGSRGAWPRGMYLDSRGKLVVRSMYKGVYVYLGSYSVENIENARDAYKVERDKSARDWYERLCSGEFKIDKRVVEYMRTWKHTCNWEAV